MVSWEVAPLAAVGLGTTTGTPAMIVEAAVYQLTGGLVTAGPVGFWAAPDAPLADVPPGWWANVRLAPPWADVAGRLVEAIDDRMVVVHEPARLEVLCRHLPDWQPTGVLFVRDLAERHWPGLDDYGLTTLTTRATNGLVTRVGPGATAEAQALTLLLRALLAGDDAGR
jgi:exodeoxyribonuclease X